MMALLKIMNDVTIQGEWGIKQSFIAIFGSYISFS